MTSQSSFEAFKKKEKKLRMLKTPEKESVVASFIQLKLL